MDEDARSSSKEDETVMRFIANYYAGIIQFHDEKDGTDVAEHKDKKTNETLQIKISVWEYIGKTLTDVLKGFATVDSGFNYKVVKSISERPTASLELKGWVYLIPASKEENNNIYNEFICVDDENGIWKWEQIGSTAITVPGAGSFIKLEDDKYSVITSDAIVDDPKTVPTTQAVYDSLLFHEKSFDLSRIITEQINTDWVEKLVVASEDTMQVPYKETFYPNADLEIALSHSDKSYLIKTTDLTIAEIDGDDSLSVYEKN